MTTQTSSTSSIEWTPAATPPQGDEWVLITVKPRNGRASAYVIIGMFNTYRRHWRTRMGQLDDWMTVLGWMPMPEPMEVER